MTSHFFLAKVGASLQHTMSHASPRISYFCEYRVLVGA